MTNLLAALKPGSTTWAKRLLQALSIIYIFLGFIVLKSVSTIKDQREDSPTDLLEWLYSLQEFEIYLVKLSSLTLLEKMLK